jgi:hypothetical protein
MGPLPAARICLAGILALIALLAAGCGGSKPPAVASLGTTPPTTTPSSGTPAGNDGAASPPAMMKKLLAFSTCMRTNDEPNFPDPLPAGGYSRSAIDGLDPKSPQYLAAMSACKSYAVAVGAIHTPAQRQQHLEQLNAEDACIREHGVPNMPGPNAQGVQSAPQGVNPTQLQAAEKTCAYLNP